MIRTVTVQRLSVTLHTKVIKTNLTNRPVENRQPAPFFLIGSFNCTPSMVSLSLSLLWTHWGYHITDIEFVSLFRDSGNCQLTPKNRRFTQASPPSLREEFSLLRWPFLFTIPTTKVLLFSPPPLPKMIIKSDDRRPTFPLIVA